MNNARQLQLRTQVVQQVEHLALHRNVESADRFVGHQHGGLHGQRAGDGDTLALAARELAWVHVPVALAGGRRCQAAGQASLVGVLAPEDALGSFGDARPDRHPRVERRVRVLEDHLHGTRAAACVPGGPAAQISMPVIDTRPEVGRVRRSSMRATVVFPLPLSPTMPSVSPGFDGERDVVHGHGEPLTADPVDLGHIVELGHDAVTGLALCRLAG